MRRDESERRLALLGDLITEIAEATGEEEIFDAVARRLPALIRTERASLALPAGDGQHLEIHTLSGEQIALPHTYVLPIADTAVGAAFRSGEARIRVADPESRLLDLAGLARAGIRQVINAPLTVGPDVLGTLNLATTRAEGYRQSDRRLLSQVARLVAAGVHGCRRQVRTTSPPEPPSALLDRLQTLNEIAERLSACLNEDQALHALLGGARRLVPAARRASVVQFDQELTRFRVIAYSGVNAEPMQWLPVRGASFERLIALGMPATWTDLEGTRYSDHLLLSRAGIRHTLSVPMITYGRIVGAVNLGLDRLPPQDADILGVLRTLGQLGGATLDRLTAHAEAHAALGSLIDSSPVLLLALDAAGRIGRVSRLGAAALGHQGELLIGEPFSLLHPGGSDAQQRAAGWARLTGDGVDVQEVQMATREGRLIWARQSARVVHSGTDAPLVLVACEDVTSVRELTSTLRHQADHDPLTGLPNRRTFARALSAALDQTGPVDPGFALLFVDLDRFKAVNDGHGHGVGDALLCAVAHRIRTELTPVDLPSRIGGDEFQVLLGDVECVGEAVGRANALREALLRGFELDGMHVDVGCSIGISLYPADGADPEELIRRADTALRHAKRLGRNNVQVYRAELDAPAARVPG